MTEDGDSTGTWIAIACGLASVSLLSIVAGVVLVFGDTGVSARDRVFQACESASAFAGSFALAAVLVLLVTKTPGEWSRGVLAVTRCIGAVLIVCAAYATWYSLTKHTRFPRPDENTSFVAFVGLNWWYRMSGVLNAIAAALVGALTILAVRRAAARTPRTVGWDHGDGRSDST